MRKKTSLIILLIATAFAFSCSKQEEKTISLAGEWAFEIDSTDVGIAQGWFNNKLTDVVTLPGTMDENKKGNLNLLEEQTTYLSRKYTYWGGGWYQKEIKIPNSWRGQRVEFYIERTKPSILWLDGTKIGEENSVSTPHIYDITKFVKFGKRQTLTILIDNGSSKLPKQVFNSHIGSEHTQTCWNGMVGNIELRAKNTTSIDKIALFPDVNRGEVKIAAQITNPTMLKGNVTIEVEAFSKTNPTHTIVPQQFEVDKESGKVEVTYSMGKNFSIWDEFNPNLYICEIKLRDGDQTIDIATPTFAMRNFIAKDKKLYNNGKRIFLRGRHDGCVFPLTGYAPMDNDSWARYYDICKEYGVNHVRFHSWTPPMAAIEEADKAGIYLQIELPLWGIVGKKDKVAQEYLKSESTKILEEYGSHPSVVMIAMGNELRGDTTMSAEIIETMKSIRPELLMATGSNNFLGVYGANTKDDFWVTCRNGGSPKDSDYKSHTRASFSFVDAPQGGIINNTFPNTSATFNSAFESYTTPIIGHETGQYQVYPNFDEIEKYRGILEPRNLVTFKKRVEKAGLMDQAKDFFRASGAWQVELYRADIEMNFRTKKISGFQLLDLQDYPGQGTALIGILDPFLDSKGFVSGEKWRQFCAPIVPLVSMDRYIYEGGEEFKAEILISNYSQDDIENKKGSWSLKNDKLEVVKSGEFDMNAPEGALTEVEKISFTMPKISKAQKMTLSVDCGKKEGANSYNVWIYPAKESFKKPNGFSVVREVGATLYKKLENGEKVLFIPKKSELKEQTIGGLFTTDYWNYRMFRQISLAKKSEVSPGTLGLLIDEKHKALADFPTDFHTNWQWYSIIKQSRPLIMNPLEVFTRPIVQPIDNLERNYKLAMIFECKVGKGKLLVCMSDLLELGHYPEAVSLYNSLATYVESNDFNPTQEYKIEELRELFTSNGAEKELNDLQNVSYDYKKSKKVQ